MLVRTACSSGAASRPHERGLPVFKVCSIVSRRVLACDAPLGVDKYDNRRKLSVHNSCVNALTFSNGDGRWLASAGDGESRV